MFKPGDKLRVLPERPFKTPFGPVHLPEIELPPLRPPKIDGHRAGQLRQALGADASDILGVIPVVGDILSRNVESMHLQAIRDASTDEEFREYIKRKKLAPFDTLALARVYIKQDTGI